jgi:hypothetical protein
MKILTPRASEVLQKRIEEMKNNVGVEGTGGFRHSSKNLLARDGQKKKDSSQNASTLFIPPVESLYALGEQSERAKTRANAMQLEYRKELAHGNVAAARVRSLHAAATEETTISRKPFFGRRYLKRRAMVDFLRCRDAYPR